jgi:hypothetical protein
MADTMRVSRSTMSRQTIEASEAALKQLLERRFGDVELLIIYIDGMHFREECVLAAVGLDAEGPANTCWRCARARHGGQGCAPIPWSTTLIRRGGACSSSTAQKRYARRLTRRSAPVRRLEHDYPEAAAMLLEEHEVRQRQRLERHRNIVEPEVRAVSWQQLGRNPVDCSRSRIAFSFSAIQTMHD